MSPRRMDISSLLRDPSPQADDNRSRHHPASLLSILNSPHSPSRSLPPPPSPPRQQFLGLDALVHVASEERRRISALSADRFPHSHDRHYNYPIHADSRHHPRPPSPEPTLPQLPSPSTRHHPSASPVTNYPTLRRQPLLHMEPTRSVTALLGGPVNDTRTIPHTPSVPLQHSAPFLHPLNPPQLPTHSSPRNTSPLRHSPQHLRSQHHSSPIQTPSLIHEPDAMSPRYSYGPRMAGGIQVFSNDSPSIRDAPRPDLSYQSPGRDLSTERFISESRVELARHEHQNLSPLSTRAFPFDDDRYQPRMLPHQVEVQESVLLRERVRSRSIHLPLVDATMDSGKCLAIPAKEVDFPAQPPPERHPIRVWEEQPTARETSRRVSPTHMPDIVCRIAEGRTWSGASESRHGERPTKEAWETEPQVAKDARTPPLFTYKEPPPPRAPSPELVASDLHTPIDGTRLDSQPVLPTPMQSWSPVQSEPRAHLPQASMTTSPVLGLHLRNLETQSELQSERPGTQEDVSTSTPRMPPDPISSVPPLGKAEAVDTEDILMANPILRQPSPELVQPVPTRVVGTFGMSQHSTHANVSQSPQPSLSILLPTKDEHGAPPDDILISPPIQPEPPSRQSSGPEYTSQREPPVSDQAMMDVDEELLSLVGDYPRTAPAMPKVQTMPITTEQGGGAGAEHGSREPSDGPSSVLSSQPVLKGPPIMTDEEKDRASMPPPAARNKKVDNDKTTLAATTGSKKKKDGTSKPAAKPKQPPKPRAKPAPKPKVKPNVVETSSKSSIPKGVVNVNARSRSTSVIPSAVDDVIPEPEVEESDKEDDKLYCVCKTRYDEDRMMIACDRCDEWFHTMCVNMPDLEIDLVDQFICPPCVQKHPHLRMTWKRRCLFGLQHENPPSPEACHKPSRGAFSKYCSDDCGIKYMQARITQWKKSGGARDLLWENVKNAAKREGVVVCAGTNGASPNMMDVDNSNSEPKPLDFAAKRRTEREVARLNARLEEVVKERELMKRELDMVMWREKVVELASERAGKVDECGWDHSLCFSEEEWADFGPEVLENYEEERVKVEAGDDAMPLDAASTMHGEWWCTGKKKCERHAGWQKLRAAEVSFDKETKEGILLKLTTREREIRKHIEDLLYPQPTSTLQAPSKPPHSEVQLNGSEKSRQTGGRSS